jgi:CheY-like chemotaxis protein
MPERRTAEIASKKTERVMRILVAEDSPDNRLLIHAYVRREPHQVDFAENGRMALDKFIAQPYDVVFMDVHMPELDGLEATKMIREWEKKHAKRASCIIALTASVLDEDVKRALAAGCTGHIGKPLTKQVLLDAIRRQSAGSFDAMPQELLINNQPSLPPLRDRVTVMPFDESTRTWPANGHRTH